MINNIFLRMASAVAGTANDAVDWVSHKIGRTPAEPKAASKADSKSVKPTSPKATGKTGTEIDVPALSHSTDEDETEVLTHSSEAFGSQRDIRSFEQKRRGGPMTGEAADKIHGPRHTGGGRRRGRDTSPEMTDALYSELPIEDYDQIGFEEIVKRLRGLDKSAVRAVLEYETHNKGRKHVIDVLERKLAA